MKIIGEKINEIRKSKKYAVTGKNSAFINVLVLIPLKAEAAWLDINTGTHPYKKPDTIVWLIETVRSEVNTSLCFESINQKAINEIKTISMYRLNHR